MAVTQRARVVVVVVGSCVADDTSSACRFVVVVAVEVAMWLERCRRRWCAVHVQSDAWFLASKCRRYLNDRRVREVQTFSPAMREYKLQCDVGVWVERAKAMSTV